MEQAPRARVLTLHGDLDLPRRQALRDALAAIEEAPVAIIDLSDVAYLDSMALAEFVRIVRLKNERDDRVLWVAPPESTVRRIFALAKLDGTFTIYDSVNAAQAAA